MAKAAGGAARFASRALGRGSGGMIGGEVAMRISPKFLSELAAPLLLRHRDRHERKVDDDPHGARSARKRRSRRLQHQRRQHDLGRYYGPHAGQGCDASRPRGRRDARARRRRRCQSGGLRVPESSRAISSTASARSALSSVACVTGHLPSGCHRRRQLRRPPHRLGRRRQSECCVGRGRWRLGWRLCSVSAWRPRRPFRRRLAPDPRIRG